MRVGRLLFPALRWDPSTGFDHESETIETGLELGVGGFIIFGGEAGAVRELTTELQRRSPVPLLIGSDLERGAGQQFRGATPLPPLAALGALDDLEATRWAGELTAREARALGIGWVYAPSADLDIEPLNPIVGTRAFGAEPGRVARHVAAWIDGCRQGGGLSCVKHFPGHGRTVADSHVELPVVDAPRETLEADLEPFVAGLRAGVDSVMSAHVAYPALDASGTPATLSRPIIGGLLREELGFDGLVVTDALIMEGVIEGGRGEAQAAVDAIAAGCDVLLYPQDPRAAADAVAGAVGNGLSEARVLEAVRRIDSAAEEMLARETGEWARKADRRRAQELAVRALRPVRGEPALKVDTVDVVTVDDDVGGPYPPAPRDAFVAELREGGVEVGERGPGPRQTLIALYADIRAWKGRPGVSAEALTGVERAIAEGEDPLIVLFGHPRLATELPGSAPVLAAWGGEPLMQYAAGEWLLRSR